MTSFLNFIRLVLLCHLARSHVVEFLLYLLKFQLRLPTSERDFLCEPFYLSFQFFKTFKTFRMKAISWRSQTFMINSRYETFQQICWISRISWLRLQKLEISHPEPHPLDYPYLSKTSQNPSLQRLLLHLFTFYCVCQSQVQAVRLLAKISWLRQAFSFSCHLIQLPFLHRPHLQSHLSHPFSYSQQLLYQQSYQIFLLWLEEVQHLPQQTLILTYLRQPQLIFSIQPFSCLQLLKFQLDLIQE